MEKIFLNHFLEYFFQKYDALERAIVNSNQFFTKGDKKEKSDLHAQDSQGANTITEGKFTQIENVKIQIENILKYIYHECKKNNLKFISDCIIEFCNDNRIIVIEERVENIGCNKNKKLEDNRISNILPFHRSENELNIRDNFESEEIEEESQEKRKKKKNQSKRINVLMLKCYLYTF